MNDRRLAERVHANLLHSQMRAARLGPSSGSGEVGPWLCLDAGDPSGLFDMAIPQHPVGDPGAEVDRALRWFSDRGRGCNFFVRSDVDAAVGQELLRRGYAIAFEEPALVMDDATVAATAQPLVDVEPVTDRSLLAVYAATGNDMLSAEVKTAIADTAFDMPGAQLFVGRVGGLVVATSMCVVTGDVIGVYNVNVLEDYRRRGIGGAMTLAALAAGVSAGGRIGWLGSTPMSDSLYRKLGFRELYRYLSFAPAQAPVR